MIDRERRQILFGDFNIEATGNLISREFKSWNFTQLVNFPTHEDGGTIDFCLVSDKIPLSSVELRQRAVPWSDHDFLQLTFVLKKRNCTKFRNQLANSDQSLDKIDEIEKPALQTFKCYLEGVAQKLLNFCWHGSH